MQAFKSLKPGDLVTIEPWECEGIEDPWGWDYERAPEASPKALRKNRRIKLSAESVGVVVSHGRSGVDGLDEHYQVIVGTAKLGIATRFLRKVEDPTC